MIIGLFKCKSCGKEFEAFKNSSLDNFSDMKPECPDCNSVDTYYKFTFAAFDIAEGKCGNGKNGYSSGFVNHTSSYGKPKGVKIKKENKDG